MEFHRAGEQIRERKKLNYVNNEDHIRKNMKQVTFWNIFNEEKRFENKIMNEKNNKLAF
jgi:hypothetical protein